jgi:MFS family permease
LPTILLLSLLSSWSGGLVKRVGARLLLVIGPAVAAVGFFLFSLPGVGGSYWTTFFPATVVLGLGMAISVAPLTTAVMSAVPAHYAGTASGINNAAARVATLLAVALLGIVMLQSFSHHLNELLATLALPAEARAMIIERRADLANLQPPASLNPELVTPVERAVAEAFVAGFRLVAYLTAALALASAAIAWFTIETDVILESDLAQDTEFG